MLNLEPIMIDRSLPIPVGKQLYGLLSYMLSFGDYPPGMRLHSVRTLAAELGIAPMTVSEVYKQLRDAGLLEIRPGLGAFTVHERASHQLPAQPASALSADIEALISKAERVGVSAMSLASMISAQAQLRRPRAGLKVLFVGIVERAAQNYVEKIRPVLASNDTIDHVTVEQFKISEQARQICREADLILTVLHRATEVQAMVPETSVLGLRFLPSENTRQALATLDPRVRITAVAHLEEYVSIMRPSIKEFAPHISQVEVTWSHASNVAEIIARGDVVVYASGAQQIAELVRPGTQCFEYRYTPDPGALETVLVPRLNDLRKSKISANASVAASTETRPRKQQGN